MTKKEIYMEAYGKMISRCNFYTMVSAMFESAESAANLLRVLNHENTFTPNWKRNGMKNRDEAVKKIVKSIRSQFGKNPYAIMDGNFKSL